MTYKLFIDDQAFDPETPDRHPPDNSWEVAISSQEAINLIDKLGPPMFLQLDHDLGLKPDGSTDTVMEFLHYLSDKYPDAIFNLNYALHSQNPIGRENVVAFMSSWLRSKSLI